MLGIAFVAPPLISNEQSPDDLKKIGHKKIQYRLRNPIFQEFSKSKQLIFIEIHGGVMRGIKNESHAKKCGSTAVSTAISSTIHIRANNCSIQSI